MVLISLFESYSFYLRFYSDAFGWFNLLWDLQIWEKKKITSGLILENSLVELRVLGLLHLVHQHSCLQEYLRNKRSGLHKPIGKELLQKKRAAILLINHYDHINGGPCFRMSAMYAVNLHTRNVLMQLKFRLTSFLLHKILFWISVSLTVLSWG